ncbi:unnamed protein product [Rhodiola kirilowii]
MGDVRQPVEKFDGSDFGFWKMQIEVYLYGKDLHQPLDEKPKDMKDEEWKLLDRKSMSAVRLSLSREVAHHTVKSKTTKEMMETLSALYEKPSASNKVHLMRWLFNLRMAEGTTVAKHLSEFNMTIAQLSSIKIEFDDEIKALILLSSLPESWSETVTAVSASSGKVKLELDEVRNLIVSEEIRWRESGSSSGLALNAGNRGRSEFRSKVQRGRSKSRGKDKQARDKSKVKCWKCDGVGHYKSECKAQSANAATEEIAEALMLSVSSPLESWVLDSGASFHSCSNADIMKHYRSGDFGKVYLADDEPFEVMGKGDVQIKAPNGSVLQLHDVRHIPDLKRNLLSVGQLDDEGYAVTFGCSTYKITKGSMVIARGKKEGTLYMTSNLQESIVVASVKGDADL